MSGAGKDAVGAGGGTLVVCCSIYPAELTLEAELAVLSECFDRILLVPSSLRSPEFGATDFPPAVEVVDEVARGGSGRLRAGDLVSAMEVARSVLGSPDPLSAYVAHGRTYAHLLAGQLRQARAMQALVERRGLHDALFYDYWFQNATLALALLRKRGVIRRCVARAHGFDVYDYRRERWVVPFRTFKAAWLDRVFAVSEDGAAYLRARLPRELRDKVTVSRLGVPPREPFRKSPSRPVVVSASHMADFKRVHEIPRVLARVTTPLRWIHFGEGPMLGETEARARRLPDHVAWELRGRVDHGCLLDFYREHPVSLFLSLSSTEGIPVSMMEALSFGVPVVAPAVGGVAELVNEGTGVLLERDWSPEGVARRLDAALRPGAFDPDEIVSFQRQRFHADTNYRRFAGMIREA